MENGTMENGTRTPVEKRRALGELLRRFGASLHLLEAKRAVAREVVELVDANPWLNDQIPYDVAASVRGAAKE